MKIELSWCDRYEIALKEYLSVRDIMKLCGVGQPKALIIRKNVIDYCIMNDISINAYKVPCDIVMLITNRDLSYYYDKMLLEVESVKLRQSIARN